MNSQPTCACSSPRSAPDQPTPWSTCGLWGSPSWSENAWCLRWSATHEITGPSIAAEPRMANTARVRGPVVNARCVSRRWKPTVTPSPVAAYMIANTIRSFQPSHSPASCQQTMPRQTIGRTVMVPVMIRSRVSCSAGSTSSARGAAAVVLMPSPYPVRQEPRSTPGPKT